MIGVFFVAVLISVFSLFSEFDEFVRAEYFITVSDFYADVLSVFRKNCELFDFVVFPNEVDGISAPRGKSVERAVCPFFGKSGKEFNAVIVALD